MERKQTTEASVNKTGMILFTVLICIIDLAYIIQFVKGEAGLGLFLPIEILATIPMVIGWIAYKTNPETAVIKHVMGIGYGLFYLVFNRFSHLDYKMTTERFRILSRRVINRVQAMNKAMPYRKPVYAACGLKTASLSYRIVRKIRERDDSFTRSYRKSLAVDSLIIFTDLGYRVSMLITGAMLVFSIAVGVYSFAFYALRNPVPGWTSTILFLSVSMFFIFMILTIVIKYLQILVNLVFKKARYNFESIEKLTK